MVTRGVRVPVERVQPDAAWDDWLALAGTEGDFLQTSRWAAIDQAANGRASVVLRAGKESGALLGYAASGGGSLTCLHGPVLVDAAATATLPKLLEGVDAVAREAGCDAVRFVGRPPRSAVPADALTAVFAASKYEVTPWATAVVDLNRDDQTLMRSFDHAARKAISRCEREGVGVIRCSDATSFERDFLSSFAAAAASSYDPERDRIAFALDGGRDYAYHVAVSPEGEVLATLGTYRFVGVATEIMSARTEAGRRSGLPAQDLLHWEVMRYHRALGDRWFDLAGYAAYPAAPSEAGIRRFKEKWHGEHVASPIFVKSPGGRLRRTARRVRKRVA